MPLGGDMPNSKELADKIAAVIRTEPFKVFNEQFQIRASIGVSTFPDDATDPDQRDVPASVGINLSQHLVVHFKQWRA